MRIVFYNLHPIQHLSADVLFIDQRTVLLVPWVDSPSDLDLVLNETKDYGFAYFHSAGLPLPKPADKTCKQVLDSRALTTSIYWF